MFDKVEGAYFKYDNTFLKFFLKNTQIRHLFWQNFVNRQIRACLLISNMIIFQIPAQKYLNEAFFFVKNTQIRHF